MGLLDNLTFRKNDAEPPEAIDLGENGDVHVVWPGGRRATIPAAKLRDRCPCAECVEEGTGRKILDPASIPADIRPEQIVAVGNYAIQITWSDGHSTGIYSWPTLREISELP